MTKYIDAEKLKAEIEKNTPNHLMLMVYRDHILALIDSLQQEQQEEPDKSLEEAAKEYAEGPECTWVGTTALEEAFKAGAKWQKEQDTRDMFMSDNRHFNKVYELGKKDMKEQMLKDAEKHLGWHSVDESLPPVDEEVIALTDEFNTAPIYKIAFGHIVNPHLTVDIDGKPYKAVSHNGWNIPGVKYWMPMPMLPKEDEK